MEAGLREKFNHLRSIILPMERALIAYSGGVDSTTLARAAIDILGASNVLAVTSASESVPKREVEYAESLANDMGLQHKIIYTRELENEEYARNDANRCYFCKHTLFSDLALLAKQEEFTHLLYGAILDDMGDFRPGMRAARELGVRGPLAEAQFTKADVRVLADHYHLPVASKPASACLSSRIPYGLRVTSGVLSQVERSEDFLKDLGFSHVRVRHHGEQARIEVPCKDIAKVASRAAEISSFMRGVGYQFVSLDLMGYRSGSLNPDTVAAQVESVS